MSKRFVSIWFRFLKTDWFSIQNPSLKDQPFVLTIPDHGRKIISATNALAAKEGIHPGMVLADARTLYHSLLSMDDPPGLSQKLLMKLGDWCIRFTPTVAIDLPDGLILDASGCTHLWGGEKQYLDALSDRLKKIGFHVRIAIAGTIAASWGFARYGKNQIVEQQDHYPTLLELPPAALRLNEITLEKFYKLGFLQVKNFIGLPGSVLRRRFGEELLKRIDEATGKREEFIEPIRPIEMMIERLSSLEPIITATGIEIALKNLLGSLTGRLNKQGKGLRKACFKIYRLDGKTAKIEIGLSHPSTNTTHLFKIFELKIETIEPGPGIELFELEALITEDVISTQEKIWEKNSGWENTRIVELIDRLQNKIANISIDRYIPDEHHWPERSFKKANNLQEKKNIDWQTDKPRPLHLLEKPELIQVTAPIPDYPPMLFRYKNKLHKIKKADGPERIEREWWIDEGPHRDYYYVEDEEGCRYWLFRSGHYGTDEKQKWFLHGIFA